MARARSNADPTFASRFECKYRISPLHAPQVRRFIEPFMRPDPYAARRPGFRYPICSLYLDTDNLALYGQTVAGEKDRYKLRVRSYSDDPAAPLFMEVKHKSNKGLVEKYRTRVEGWGHANRREELDLLSICGLERMPLHPVITIQYERITLVAKNRDDLWGDEAVLASNLGRLLVSLQGVLGLLHADGAPSKLVRKDTTTRKCQNIKTSTPPDLWLIDVWSTK